VLKVTRARINKAVVHHRLHHRP